MALAEIVPVVSLLDLHVLTCTSTLKDKIYRDRAQAKGFGPVKSRSHTGILLPVFLEVHSLCRASSNYSPLRPRPLQLRRRHGGQLSRPRSRKKRTSRYSSATRLENVLAEEKEFGRQRSMEGRIHYYKETSECQEPPTKYT